MEEILNKYDDLAGSLKDLNRKAESLLVDLMKANTVNVHQIASRVKTRESLTKKLSRKQGYETIEDITDIVGCRIIAYFEDDVDRIAEIIESEFDIDRENSVDKRKIEFDRFGYLSLHYVVKFNSKRLRLAEYKKFKEIKFEIQIRSILQHSWAEIEHDIGYKGKFSIPTVVKRRFSRIAALLETADLEFVRLRDDLKVYEKNIKKEIANDPSKVSLDKASLISFIIDNKNLQKADLAVAKYLNIDLSLKGPVGYEERISLLQQGDIYTIQDLQKLYSNYLDCIVEFSKYWRGPQEEGEKKGRGINGISIYDAAYFQLAKHKNREELEKIFSNKFKETPETGKREMARCIDAFNKTNKNCH